MQTETNVTESQNVTQNVTSDDQMDYKALLEQTKADYEAKIQAIAKKKDELLNETKAAKAAREEAAKKASEEAEKNGEFEKLWKQEAQERENLHKQLQQFQTEYKQEKINSYSIKLANELAKEDGGLSANILSELLAKNISAMADERGSLTSDVYEAIKKSAMTNKAYSPLLAGNKSTGGGAPGSNSAKSTTKEMSRADFDNLDHASRRKFLSTGGKITTN